MTKTKTNITNNLTIPTKVAQLNTLLFNGSEKELRETLYEKIKPLFPTSVTLRATIDHELARGIQVQKYVKEMQGGGKGFCDDCVEPTCCTLTNPVALLGEDVERLKEHGHRNFYKNYTDPLGNKYQVIKESAPCMFLKNDRCTIYSYRPLVCHRYPMQENAEDGKQILLISADCAIAFNLIRRQVIDAMR